VTVTKQTGTMLMAITGQKDFSNKKQKQNNTKENEHRVLSTD
jgi:hypothetical protein